jgi:hypothetical protein
VLVPLLASPSSSSLQLQDRIKQLAPHEHKQLQVRLIYNYIDRSPLWSKTSFLARFALQMLRFYRLVIQDFDDISDMPRARFFIDWIESSQVLLQRALTQDPTLLPEPAETIAMIVKLSRAISVSNRPPPASCSAFLRFLSPTHPDRTLRFLLSISALRNRSWPATNPNGPMSTSTSSPPRFGSFE